MDRVLRGFLANERNGCVSESQWEGLRRMVVNAEGYDHQRLRSSVGALWRQKHCVSTQQWNVFVSQMRIKLRNDGKVELLERIEREFRNQTSGTLPLRKVEVLRSEKKQNVEVIDLVAEDNTEPAPREEMLAFLGFHLLKTAGVADAHRSLSIEDIVVPGAEMAVLCNYKFDIPWLWNRAPAIQTCRKVLVIHGEGRKEEELWKQFLQSESASDRVRFVRPETPLYGTVHSKCFLLFYPHGCRVCIHTANMIPQDWESKTQGAYIRDFPLNAQQALTRVDLENEDFKSQLFQYFSRSLNGSIKAEVLASIRKYDFSSAGVALVTSVPGTHHGTQTNAHGYLRLKKLLQKHVDCVNEDSVAVCQFSSLGSIQKGWLEEDFHDVLFANKKLSSTKKKKHFEDIQLVLPTVEQVQASNEGLMAGASLPITRKNVFRDHILRRLYKWDASISNREQAMPHIKTYLRYAVSRPQSPLWVLLGSFNLSVAAWGRYIKADKGHTLKRLRILSYEIGVLFVPCLSCPAVFCLDDAPLYDLWPSIKRSMWTTAKDTFSVSLVLDTKIPKESWSCDGNECDAVKSSSNTTNVSVVLPIPYGLPLKRYQDADIPWTVECCSMT